MIIWIHGKSNSGKTTLAKQFLKEVKKEKKILYISMVMKLEKFFLIMITL